MEIVVADANIFVYFFITGLINKILNSSDLNIKITQTVYRELTNNYRITTEYPMLSEIIINAVHNINASNNLECIDFNTRELNVDALNIYYHLDNRGNLDPGELDSIPLAYDLNAIFVTNDNDAIVTANEVAQNFGRMTPLAISFLIFCENLLERNIIDKNELERINALFQ